MVLKRAAALTFVSLLCSSVHAEVTQEKADGENYIAAGYKTVGTPCTVEGIAQDYANPKFLRGFLPPNLQAGLKEVKWDAKAKKLYVFAIDNYTMACEEKAASKSVSLMCRFDPVPTGVKFLWFKITRTQEGTSCVETGNSSGQFSNLVRAKGYTPESLHQQVGMAFLAPYREGNGRAVASGPQHAARAKGAVEASTRKKK